MLLNHTFIGERCVIQCEAVVLVQQSGQQCLPDFNGDGRELPPAGNTGNVFILKIFLICRDKMGKLRGESTGPEQRVIPVVYFFVSGVG